jgi:hypothetical protein
MLPHDTFVVRAAGIVVGMGISIVVRLVPAARSGGRLAGQVEVVASGERAVFGDQDELLALLRRFHAERGPAGAGPTTTDEDAGAGTDPHRPG